MANTRQLNLTEREMDETRIAVEVQLAARRTDTTSREDYNHYRSLESAHRKITAPSRKEGRSEFFEAHYDDLRQRIERALDLLDATEVEPQTQGYLARLRSILEGSDA
jgi:hypothetical protein